MSELQHGILLQDQGRTDEAEACFRSVLSREPENDFVYGRLALCQLNQEGKKRDALESIDEAIRISPNESFYHCVRSLILTDLHRGKEALVSANQATVIDPEDAFPFAAKANAYCELHRWADAEEWSRKALAIDSDHVMAASILTHALRLQGKADENEMAVDQLLAADPENSLAHVNAGWAALQRFENEKAEEHFREALCLDPEFEAAREGLLESFKARSWFYRAYLSYCFAMQRFTGGKQWAIIIGFYLAYQVLRNVLSPVASGILVFCWLTFIMWIWLAPGIGNFLVFLDGSARLALTKSEKRLGIAVGGGLFLGVMALITGWVWNSNPAMLFGAGLVLSSIPASLAFDNESRKGRWVFGSMVGYIYAATLIVTGLEFATSSGNNISDLSWALAVPAFFAAILCTWLGNVKGLRQDDSG